MRLGICWLHQPREQFTRSRTKHHYEGGSRLVGHELVLYSLLVIDDARHYPWNVFRQKHSALYQ